MTVIEMMSAKKAEIKQWQIGFEFGNAVVPEFNSSGKPDLLAWDEAMDETSTQKEIRAVLWDGDLVKSVVDHLESQIEE